MTIEIKKEMDARILCIHFFFYFYSHIGRRARVEKLVCIFQPQCKVDHGEQVI